MSSIFPFIGAISNAASEVLERTSLKKRKLKVSDYQVTIFLFTVLLMIPGLFFFWKFDNAIFNLTNILIFLGVIALAVLANYLFFLGFKKGALGKLESARITEYLFSILLAFFLSFLIPEIYQSTPKILIPSLIAGITLVLTHIKKHHLKFSSPYKFVLMASFLFALETVISKLILGYFSSYTFYFIRSVFVLIISLIIFKPKLKNSVDKKISIRIFFTAFTWIITRVALYYGYINLGIEKTILIMMSTPVMIYFVSWFYLKEKITWKNIVSGGVITLCIIYTLI
jgi:drug/metabolite transporter (DMT)-like permease